MSDPEMIEYLPKLGPWRAGYRYDPTVLVGSPSKGYVPCTPGSAAILFFMWTGQWPTPLPE
jgi:hypothetical protein